MKLSVIMPVYNCGNYVAQAIQSVINQTFSDFEFIIINDGSTDTTSEICNQFAKMDNRILLVEQENQGLIASLNLGLKLSSGEYIVRMDADDVSYPDRFKRQVEFMDSNPCLIASGCYYNLIGEKSGIVKVPDDTEQCKSLLKASSCIAHPTAIFRKTNFLDGSGIFYSTDFKHVEDYHLWVRLSTIGEISNISEVLLDYRVHAEQVTQKFNTDMIKNQMAVVSLSDFPEKQLILTILNMKLDFNFIVFFQSFLKLYFSLRRQKYLRSYLARVLISSLKNYVITGK